MTALIDAVEVDRIFRDCITDSSDGHLVNGIVHTVMFDMTKVEQHRATIEAWIPLLNPAFLDSGGGGWTFLNLCEDRDGNQWTGLHRTMEFLVMLCMAIDRASFPLPREIWDALPGGMPYVCFTAP